MASPSELTVRLDEIKLHGKSLLQSDSLYQYILDTTVLPREPDCMRELREITDKHPWSMMMSASDEMQFLSMLLKIMNAKNAIEIGVFTGYSLLATALALPDDGKILALDIKRDDYDIGLPLIQKAGVEHKIDFRQGPALTTLDELLAEEKNKGTFDFAFVDADKPNYCNYHERVIELVRIGGVIAYDNTLWGGYVTAPPDMPLSDMDRLFSSSAREFNKAIAADSRVEVCQLSIADGLTLCRRLI